MIFLSFFDSTGSFNACFLLWPKARDDNTEKLLFLVFITTFGYPKFVEMT